MSTVVRSWLDFSFFFFILYSYTTAFAFYDEEIDIDEQICYDDYCFSVAGL